MSASRSALYGELVALDRAAGAETARVAVASEAVLTAVLRIGRILRTERGGKAVVAMKDLFVCARAYAEAVDGPVTNHTKGD